MEIRGIKKSHSMIQIVIRRGLVLLCLAWMAPLMAPAQEMTPDENFPYRGEHSH